MKTQLCDLSDENKCAFTDDVLLPLKVDWSVTDSFAVEWNDGHIPETLIHNSSASQQQWLRVYPKYHGIPNCCRGAFPGHHDSSPSSPQFLYCWDDAAPDDLADTVYRTTVKQKTWGSYVTMHQIRQYWDNHYSDYRNLRCQHDGCALDHRSEEDSIALPAAAWFIRNFVSASNDQTTSNHLHTHWEHRNSNLGDLPEDSTSSPENIKNPSMDVRWDHDMSSILHEAHGVAVWALASDIGSHVPYHLDYAELLRYETGVIVPPIIAGTWHCSRRHYNSFSGGDYCVVVHGNGLDHYHSHGYKGKLKIANVKTDLNENEGNLSQIPYMFNRMICHSGHFPHWSTLVEAPFLTVQDSPVDVDFILQRNARVVVGFNVFLQDVGPLIQPAPEHSEEFRKRVQKSRRSYMSNAISMKAAVANPCLRRILVLAKRKKQKDELILLKIDMEDRIQKYLETHQSASVKELKELLFPFQIEVNKPLSTMDLHVCIHKLWRCDKIHVVEKRQNRENTHSQLIPEEWLVALTNKS